jgi:hypothetical protein
MPEDGADGKAQVRTRLPAHHELSVPFRPGRRPAVNGTRNLENDRPAAVRFDAEVELITPGNEGRRAAPGQRRADGFGIDGRHRVELPEVFELSLEHDETAVPGFIAAEIIAAEDASGEQGGDEDSASFVHW